MTTIERIMSLINQHNTTANKVAIALGFNNGIFSQWKAGKQKPSVDAIIKLANYFGVSVDYLMGRTPFKTHEAAKELAEALACISDEEFEQSLKEFDLSEKAVAYLRTARKIVLTEGDEETEAPKNKIWNKIRISREESLNRYVAESVHINKTQLLYEKISACALGERFLMPQGNFVRQNSCRGDEECFLVAKHCASLPVNRFGKPCFKDIFHKTELLYVFDDYCQNVVSGTQDVFLSRAKVLARLEPNESYYFEILGPRITEVED